MITLKDLIDVLDPNTDVCLRHMEYPNYSRTITENRFGYITLDMVSKYLDYYVTDMKLVDETLEVTLDRGYKYD